jgi:hypothetical protein
MQKHQCVRNPITLASIMLFAVSSLALTLPDAGFVIYSKGDAGRRTLTMRKFENGGLGPEQKICDRGSHGGDIEGQISFDGKWLAFARSLSGTKDGYGGNDYHSFNKWDIYIVNLAGSLPAKPIKVGHGYFPCWGDDSDGPTKTLYFSVAENKSIKKATISDDGTVSNVVKHCTVPTATTTPHMMGSPDGKYVAYRMGPRDKTTRGETQKAVTIYNVGSGKKVTSQKGCHPAWCADSKWLIHASAQAIRYDGSNHTYLSGGDYHHGTSVDMKWYINRTSGNWRTQNLGEDVHLMKMSATNSSLKVHSGDKMKVTSDGSWVDVHVGAVASAPDVAIESFEASSNSVDEGTEVTLSWAVTGATSLTLNGEEATGTSTTVTPETTTEYTLEAQGQNGPVSRTVTVEVIPTVAIRSGRSDLRGGSVLSVSRTEGERFVITVNPANAAEKSRLSVYGVDGSLLFSAEGTGRFSRTLDRGRMPGAYIVRVSGASGSFAHCFTQAR